MNLFYRVVVIAVLLAVAGGAFAQPGEEQNPDPGTGDGSGGTGCSDCSTTVLWTGEYVQSCVTLTTSGLWGSTGCTVECYEEGCYCYTYGDACCVD